MIHSSYKVEAVEIDCAILVHHAHFSLCVGCMVRDILGWLLTVDDQAIFMVI